MNATAAFRSRAPLDVLVAGGAGFLGSHLCERLLADGHRVTCLDSYVSGLPRNVAHLRGEHGFVLLDHDICEPLPSGLHFDAIYNLACAASPPRYQADPVHTMMTSVVGTRNLLDLAERCGARLVQASTSEVYGDPEEHPQRESYFGNVNPIGPRACYDEGKRAAEALCYDFLRLGRADVRVARIFNTYGPRMRPDDGRIISNLVSQALAGAPLTIYGTGEQTRSFCYVDDLLAGLVALMSVEATPEGPVNLGNPGEFTVNQLAGLVLEMTGSSSVVHHMPLPHDDPQRRRPDIDRARRLLDWQPETTLADGLPPTIAWFAGEAAAQDDSSVAAPAPRAVALAAAGIS